MDLIGWSIEKEIADARWRDGMAAKMGVLKSLGVISPEDFQKSMEGCWRWSRKLSHPASREAQ